MEINGQLIRQVWEKGNQIVGQDPDVFRVDVQGCWIRKKDFNNSDSIYGWTIYSTLNNETFAKSGSLIPVHTYNNPIPLAGIQSPVQLIFGDNSI